MTISLGRVLGIDYGSKRIGVAVSDPTRLIAQGVETVLNNSHSIDHMRRIVRELDVQCIVVGMPYGPKGEIGGKAREVERFIEVLRRAFDIPIKTWDESYSSVDAQRVFLQGGMKRKQRRQKARVDEMAARLMLQEYLDSSSRVT